MKIKFRCKCRLNNWCISYKVIRYYNNKDLFPHFCLKNNKTINSKLQLRKPLPIPSLMSFYKEFVKMNQSCRKVCYVLVNTEEFFR